jgi:hypothetical protein
MENDSVKLNIPLKFWLKSLLVISLSVFLSSCATVDGFFADEEKQASAENTPVTAEEKSEEKMDDQFEEWEEDQPRNDRQTSGRTEQESMQQRAEDIPEWVQEEMEAVAGIMSDLKSQGCKTIVSGDKGVYVCAMKDSDHVSWAVGNALSYAVKVNIHGAYNFKKVGPVSKSYELNLDPGEVSHDMPGSIEESFSYEDAGALQSIKAKVSWRRNS